MAFDAGSIVAKLELDRDPFQRGIDEAKAESDKLEGRTIRPKVDVQTDGIDEAKARLDTLKERVQANVGVDSGEARAEIAALDSELRKLHRKVAAQVGVDGVPETLVEIETVQHELDRIDHRRVSADVDTTGVAGLAAQATQASSKISTLAVAAATLGPALVPVGAAAIGAVGALGGAFAGAGAGLGAFALVAKPALAEVAAAATKTGAAQKKALAELGPGAAGAVHAFKEFHATWMTFQRSFQPQVFALMNVGLSTAKSLLPALRPLISNTADALIRLAREASRALQGPYWQHFFAFLSGQAGPAITTFGRVLGNLAHGFAGLMQAFSPLIGPMEHGLVRLSAAFAQWGSSVGQTQGFQRLLDYIRQTGPMVLHTIGDLAKVVADLGPAFAHSGVQTLRMVDDILRLTDGLLRAHPLLGQTAAVLAPISLIMLKLVGPISNVAKGIGALGKAFSAMGGMAGIAMRVERAIGMLASVGTRIMALLVPAIEAVEGAVVGLAATIGAPVAVVVAAIAAVIAIAVLVATHWKQTKQILDAVWHGIEAAAKAVWSAIKTVITEEVKLAVAYVKTEFEIAKTVVLAVWHAMEAAAKAVWDAIKTAVTTAVRFAVDFVRDHWKLLPAIFLGPLGVIATLFLKFHDQIIGTVKTVVGDVVRFFGELPGRMLAIGENAMRGLINGIKNMAGAVTDAVKGVVKGAIHEVTSGFGIFSPSRVFHGFGFNMMQGWADGIRAGAPSVIAAVSDAGGKLKDTAGAVANAWGGWATAGPQAAAVAGIAGHPHPVAHHVAATTGAAGTWGGALSAGTMKAAALAGMTPAERTAYHDRFERRKALGLPSLAGLGGKDLSQLRGAGLYGDQHVDQSTTTVNVTMPRPAPAHSEPDPRHIAALLGEELRRTHGLKGRRR